MRKKIRVVGNEQAFQSIYLDPTADRWQDVIVFHEPIFDEEISGVIALKSLRLEDAIGFVIAAPTNVLRVFKEKVRELDEREEWGKLDVQEIVNRLMSLATDLKGSIAYQQNMKKFISEKIRNKKPEKPEKPEKSEKSEEAYFFDPVTKKKIVDKGVHYFDPSLPTVEDVEDLVERRKRREKTSAKLIYSPAGDVCPANISEEGRPLWPQVVAMHREEILESPFNKNRWAKARNLYAGYCQKLQIAPYRDEDKLEPFSIWARFKDRWIEARAFERDLLNTLYSRGLLESAGAAKVEGVERLGDDYHVILTRMLKAVDFGEAAKFLLSERNFTSTSLACLNILKRVSGNTQYLLKLDPDDSVLTAHLISRLSGREASILYGTGDSSKLRCGIAQGAYRMIKTGHATLKNFRRGFSDGGGKKGKACNIQAQAD